MGECHSSGPPPPAGHIAVIDDDPDFLAMVADVLDMAGYGVAAWTDPCAALQALGADPPMLAIIDLRMDRPTAGLEVLCRIRRDSALRGTPVIVCSADAVALHEQAATLRAHGAELLEKPFDLDDLLALISRLTYHDGRVPSG